jgi:hypothetical protein
VYSRLVVFAALFLLSACKIEPTPREFIDRQVPVDAVRDQAQSALRDRISALVEALRAGDVALAEATLAPAPDVLVIGPGEGERLVGSAQITAILDLLATSDAATIELIDVETRVGPRATSGWFFARLEVRTAGGDAVPVRVTGIYQEREAAWQLEQAHFSIPSNAFTPPAPRAPGTPAEDG